MPRVELPITGGYYVSRSRPISAQTCKNLYVHINRGGGLAPESLYGTPGALQLASSGNEAEVNRGAREMDDVPYFVNGSHLYALRRVVSGLGAETFSMEALGTIAGEGRVSLADNGKQLCILVPGVAGYIYEPDAATPFQQITDPDFTANGVPQHVRYVDGYFVFTTGDKKFIISGLNDGLSYNALDFGSAEADPDSLIVPVVVNNQLYIGGTITLEPFRNIGGADFPFARLEGGVINIGVSSAFSMVNVSKTFMFIGGGENEGPSVYMFTGSDVEPISTDAIDDLLEALTPEQLSNVFGWSYSEGGARFVGWTLPDITIVYDMTSGRWHERSSYDVINDVSSEFRWRANSVVKAYGRILIGDSIDGRVGAIDLDFYDEYGNDIVREIASVPFSNQGDDIKVPSMELVVESGVGNKDVPDPSISMSRSLDGKTFTNPRTRKTGKIGKFDRRVIWRRNGRAARFEVFKWTMSDRVKWVLITAWANIK